MKFFKTLSVSLLLAGAMVNTGLAATKISSAVYVETPAKTVFFKHPMAADADKFFSSSKIYNFEIYKVGSKEDLSKVIDALKKDADVEDAVPGVITGDYQAITLVLKSEKNKQWFIGEFKKAGLNNIKINNNAIVEVDKM